MPPLEDEPPPHQVSQVVPSSTGSTTLSTFPVELVREIILCAAGDASRPRYRWAVRSLPLVSATWYPAVKARVYETVVLRAKNLKPGSPLAKFPHSTLESFWQYTRHLVLDVDDGHIDVAHLMTLREVFRDLRSLAAVPLAHACLCGVFPNASPPLVPLELLVLSSQASGHGVYDSGQSVSVLSQHTQHAAAACSQHTQRLRLEMCGSHAPVAAVGRTAVGTLYAPSYLMLDVGLEGLRPSGRWRWAAVILRAFKLRSVKRIVIRIPASLAGTPHAMGLEDYVEGLVRRLGTRLVFIDTSSLVHHAEVGANGGLTIPWPVEEEAWIGGRPIGRR